MLCPAATVFWEPTTLLVPPLLSNEYNHALAPAGRALGITDHEDQELLLKDGTFR